MWVVARDGRAVKVESKERLNSELFVRELTNLGYTIGSGVPCSWLSGLTNACIDSKDLRYVMAAQEGDAVAIASGADLAGSKGLVTMQGSGLTNAGSPLTSYNYSFRRGILIFVSLRGEPGLKDEPQHELMGRITAEQLELWRVKHTVLAPDKKEAREQLRAADVYVQAGQPFAFIVRKHTFTEHVLEEAGRAKRKRGRMIDSAAYDARPQRLEALKRLVPFREEGDVLLTTNGYTGRELFELSDAPNQIMLVGSMGCVSSLALGAALQVPQHRFIAIDGDGALLMRLGSLATNAREKPSNLLHLLLDNGCHESTGCQKTASDIVDWAELALAAGYSRVVRAHNLEELTGAIGAWHKQEELTFVYLRIKPGTYEGLGRPTVTPEQAAVRLRAYLETS